MTASEKAQEIIDTYCAPGVQPNREGLKEAIRRAILRADIELRQPRELTPAQAGTIAYQILYFVDEWTTTLRHAEYPAQANRLAQCRASILALANAAPRKPVSREILNPKAKAKGAHA
jgi:hypothetical protein